MLNALMSQLCFIMRLKINRLKGRLLKCSRPFILYRIKRIIGFIVEFGFIFTDRVAGIFFEHTV